MMTSQKCPRCGVEIAATEAQGKFDGVCPKCLIDSVFGTPFLTTQIEKTAPMPAVGGEFGNYVILGVLGSGAMGVVYKARQKGLERTVALKILPAGKDAPAELGERFFREARLAAQLQHPNIVPIHEVSSQGGAYFYSMDLVEGATLSEFHKKRGLASREAVEILEKIARAVHYAHEQGVLHRDLKPHNIMVDRAGEPKVLDFGIAKSLSTQSGLTTSGSAMGTPPYMSPEQAAGSKSIDARADVYSLGAILYEILTGKPPHTGETAMEVYRKIATEEPVAPTKRNPKVQRKLEVICLKALNKKRADRYASADALATDVRRYLDGWPIVARPPSAAIRFVRFVRRHAAMLLLSFLLTAAGGGLLWMSKVKITDPFNSFGDSFQNVGKKLGTGFQQGQQVALTIDRADQTLETVRFGTSSEERAERWKKLEVERENLTQALDAHPEVAELYYWRGRVLETSGRSAEAIADYAKALERDPRYHEARYRRIAADYRRFSITVDTAWQLPPAFFGRMKADLAVLEKVPTRRERAILLKGLLKFTQGMWDVTRDQAFWTDPNAKRFLDLSKEFGQALEDSLRENPTFFDALLLRALFTPIPEDLSPVPSSSWQEREACGRRAAAIEPNDGRCYEALSQIHQALEDWGGALADADEIVDLNPRDLKGRLLRADVFWNLGLFSLSSRETDAALEIAPQSPEPYFRRASMRFSAWTRCRSESTSPDGGWAPILQDLDAAIEREKSDGMARLTRAMIRRTWTHDEAGAQADYQAWSKDNPDHPWVRSGAFEKMAKNKGSATMFSPFRAYRASTERAREGCVAHAKRLCRKLTAGADRAALLPVISALVERAFELGHANLDGDFDVVRNEPAIREIEEKHSSCSRLVYRLLYPDGDPGDRNALAEEMTSKLRLELQSAGFPNVSVANNGYDTVVVRLPNVGREDFEKAKALLRRTNVPESRFACKVVATREIHERWQATGTVPEGYEVVLNGNVKLSGEPDYLEKREILVRRDPILTESDVRVASASSSGPGTGWEVDIRLTPEGSARFNRAAKELFHQDPKGKIAIIVQGHVVSVPTIESQSFGDQMTISGRPSKEDAIAFAAALERGKNHVRIGRAGAPGEPLEEVWMEPKK